METTQYLEQISAGSEPLNTATGVLATGTLAKYTPVMIDATAKQLKVWDKTPGTAVGITALAVDASGAPARFPYFKTGCINIALIAWPDGTTEDEKLVAFAGSPISVAALGF